MKKVLLTLLLVGATPMLPANANPVVTKCFNSLIEHPNSVPVTATLLLTVDHNGSQYHVIEKDFKKPRSPLVKNYIRTDAQGGCEKLMAYQEGSYPEIAVYKEKLGPEVFEKIKQAFRERRAQEAGR
ncbi:hypothetical protein ACSYAD_33925 [Acaryochloris marina NIES-2412]|uniref:hypothetical protein n=1 Tax=Acaryochloris marina TaxID=155978 RepID=UPI0040585E2A